MPRSVNKRKNGKVKKSVPKTYFVMSTFNKKSIATIVDAITSAEVAVEMKLHRGKCSYNDLGAVREVSDAAQIALLNRDCFSDETVDEFIPLFIKCTEAIYAVARRAKERKDGKLVCNADELEHIRDHFIPAAQLVRESFKSCPRIMLHEWEFMLKQHEEAKDKPFIELTRAQVRKGIQAMVGNAGHYIKKRYQNA